MALFHKEQMQRQYNHAVKDRRGKHELCLSWIAREKQFSWFDEAMLKEQMKIWRKLAKQGELKIMEYNNTSHKVNGKTFYDFVVQPYHNGEMEDCPMCPYSLLINGIMVSGYTYTFTKQENRDAIYNYVMKDISQRE